MSFETVNKLNRDFEDNYNNGQVKEAVSTYANDARLFSNDKQVYQGLSQLEKYYSGAIADGNTKVELHTGEVIQCGSDYLVETRFLSFYKMIQSFLSFIFSTYKLNADGGNYVVIWKKDGGQWKKMIDIFN
jgi:ketosteroid isomerase-like protein